MLTVNCDNCGRKVSVVDLVEAWDEKVCLVCVRKMDGQAESGRMPVAGVEVLPQAERRRHRKAMLLLGDMQSWYRDYPYLDEGLSGLMCRIDELLAEVAE